MFRFLLVFLLKKVFFLYTLRNSICIYIFENWYLFEKIKAIYTSKFQLIDIDVSLILCNEFNSMCKM